MNTVKEIERINQRELDLGIGPEASWHARYKDTAWVYAGGLPYQLTEGDIVCVFSQWGEIDKILEEISARAASPHEQHTP